MRALEVLSRNGSRPPSQLKAGPLTGVARFFVQQVIRYIVRNHQTHVVDSIRDLYARRLGWIPGGDPARIALVRARLDVERASPPYKSGRRRHPNISGGRRRGVVTRPGGPHRRQRDRRVARRHRRRAMATFVVLFAASWAILRGAAVARRRIRLTLDGPLGALWETIGWCGHPPRETRRGSFALIAIALDRTQVW